MSYSTILSRKLFILCLGPGLMTVLFLPIQATVGNCYSGVAEQSAPQDLIPAATLPATDDELKWWQAVRTAGREAITAWARKDAAIAEAKRKQMASRGSISSSDEKDLIPHGELTRLNAAIAAATKQFLDVIREGSQKSYHVPVPDNRPIILHKTKPGYTDDARHRKVNGSVSLSMTFLADGMIGEIDVVRRLDVGLDEKATEAARQILFLPAVKGGLFVPFTSKVEMTFNAY
jgi:TonB family protein